jgi:hypothetical protein
MAQAQQSVQSQLIAQQRPWNGYTAMTVNEKMAVGTNMTALQEAQRRALMAVGNMQTRGRQAASSPLAGARLLQAPAFAPTGGTAATKMLLGQ